METAVACHPCQHRCLLQLGHRCSSKLTSRLDEVRRAFSGKIEVTVQQYRGESTVTALPSTVASFASLSAISFPCTCMRFHFEQDYLIARMCSSCPILLAVVYGSRQLSMTVTLGASQFSAPNTSSLLLCSPSFRAFKSTNSSALLMVLSMPRSYGCTLRLRCACSCSLYTPEPVTRPMCGISFLLPSVFISRLGGI